MADTPSAGTFSPWKRVRTLPRDDATNGWDEPLPRRPVAPRLRGEERCDCAIVGAGYTGLAVARRLAELRPDWRVVLLEAQQVAAGASGRASGFVVDLTDFAAGMEPEARRRYVALARSGIDELKKLVERHGIDCAWDETGWLRAAAGDAGVRFLDQLPAIYGELGISYQRLDRDEMTAVTGSRFYRSGFRLPGYPLVHSAALVRGLADATPESVELYERSPVRAIERGSALRLVAGDGAVVADRVFLATNGYTPALGFLARRVFPLYTFGSLTPVLSPAEQDELGGEREWGLLAMDPMGSTVRRTRDQRILIRNTIHYDKTLRVDEAVRRKVVANHRRAFVARFPALAEVRFRHTWAGLMGTVKNGQLSFGEVGERIFTAAGYTAAGIAMGATAGRLLADLAVGRDSRELSDILALPAPTWMPPEPFRSLGGRWLAGRMDAKAGDCL